MPEYLALVALRDSSDLARNDIVNTLAFNDRGLPTDPTGLATDLANVYAALWSGAIGMSDSVDTIDVRFYDRADPTPRPIKGQHIRACPAGGAPGPREVALCLSFYAERNLPRQRGRIFVGPWAAGAMADRPATSLQTALIELGQDFADLGGVDVDWCVFSRTDDEFRPVTNTWCDDAWDTVRSRGLDPLTRLTGTPGS